MYLANILICNANRHNCLLGVGSTESEVVVDGADAESVWRTLPSLEKVLGRGGTPPTRRQAGARGESKGVQMIQSLWKNK